MRFFTDLGMDGLGRRLARGAACAALGAAWLTPWKPGVVVGRSMEPSLHDGQLCLLDRRCESIRKGDVVVFRHAGETYVKRVVAVGGESIPLVRYRVDNGRATLAPGRVARLRRLISDPVWAQAFSLDEVPVGPGSYFVVGDNRGNSVDSCDFGPIRGADILARVVNAPPLSEEQRVATLRTPAAHL